MRWWLLCVVLVPLAAPPAFACGDGKTLLTDSFDTLQPMWGKADDFMQVADGRMVLSEEKGKSYTAYAEPTFDDMDSAPSCGSPRPATKAPLTSAWSSEKDANNFYTFQITPDGSAAVYQMVDNKWQDVIKDRASASIHQGAVRFNELEVVTRGHLATLIINGDRFDDVAGEEPDGGQHVGFSVQAPDAGDATFAIDDLLVTAGK
ncbi:MAG: hypothetical protein WDM84_08900 [Bauldia sp.]